MTNMTNRRLSSMVWILQLEIDGDKYYNNEFFETEEQAKKRGTYLSKIDNDILTINICQVKFSDYACWNIQNFANSVKSKI